MLQLSRNFHKCDFPINSREFYEKMRFGDCIAYRDVTNSVDDVLTNQ